MYPEYSENDFRLYHHGILGMHWGVRNGPPYPLGASDHSASERKAGWQKSLSKQGSTKKVKSAQNDEKSWENRRKKITSKDRSDYRKQMASRYSKKNSKLANFYKNATDKQIDLDIEQKQRLKKALIATAIVAGTAVAIGVAYKTGAFRKVLSAASGIAPHTGGSTPNLLALSEAVKQAPDVVSGNEKKLLSTIDPKLLTAATEEALDISSDDIGLVLDPSTTLHRMVAYSDFDLDKVSGPMYASYKPTDVAAYEVFLKDWNRTGERYHVQLGIKDKLVAPTREKTEQIVKQVFDTNTKKGKKALYQLADDYVDFVINSRLPDLTVGEVKEVRAQLVKEIYDKMASDDSELFSQAIWNIVRPSRTSHQIQGAVKNSGFNMLIDYMDAGDLAQTPVILFNASNDLKYLGQSTVTKETKKQAIQFMNEHLDEVVPDLQQAVSVATSSPDYMEYLLKP